MFIICGKKRSVKILECKNINLITCSMYIYISVSLEFSFNQFFLYKIRYTNKYRYKESSFSFFFLQACDCKQRDYSNNNLFSCTKKQIFTKINKFPSKYQLERFRTTIHFISNGSLLYFHSPRSRFLSHDPWFNDFNTKGVSFSLPFFLFFIDLRR